MEEENNGASIAKTTQLSTYRRDLWPSRKAAADSYKRSPFYQTWEPRVLSRWVQYGLRDLPTAIHPLDENARRQLSDGTGNPVTLTSTLHQEVFTFARPNYDYPPESKGLVTVNRSTHPDLDYSVAGMYPFYRPEGKRLFDNMPHLRPSVMYVVGEKSDICSPETNEEKLTQTGTGVGGSGGFPIGRVGLVALDKTGHLVAMEAPVRCAEIASGWLGPELKRWRDEEEAFRVEWNKKSKVEKMTVDDRWKAHVPPLVRKPKPAPKL